MACHIQRHRIPRHRPVGDSRWYWAVCAVTIYGEDDRCTIRSPVYSFYTRPRRIVWRMVVDAHPRGVSGGWASVYVTQKSKGVEYRICSTFAGRPSARENMPVLPRSAAWWSTTGTKSSHS